VIILNFALEKVVKELLLSADVVGKDLFYIFFEYAFIAGGARAHIQAMLLVFRHSAASCE
jgi:hypothetical protein